MDDNCKKIRFEVSIKNNRLYREVHSRYSNISDFCRSEAITQYQHVVGFISLKESPYLVKGFSPLAIKLCEILGRAPEWLFPPELYADTKRGKFSIEYNLRRIPLGLSPEQITYDPCPDLDIQKKIVSKVLDTLPERCRVIIEERYGLSGAPDKTLTEVAKKLNVTRERIRQIEGKAMRMLRSPSRARVLSRAFYGEATNGR